VTATPHFEVGSWMRGKSVSQNRQLREFRATCSLLATADESFAIGNRAIAAIRIVRLGGIPTAARVGSLPGLRVEL
jgi:hypothetical protein